MKILILFFTLINITGTGTWLDEVEYGHRRIRIEISKTLSIDNFKLTELKSDNDLHTYINIPGKYFEISSINKSLNYMYVGRVFTCPAGGCSENDLNTVSFEYFDYLVLFDNTASVIKVSVFNYQATHGQEVCSKGWLKQFIGFNGSQELRVGKNIDAISGATKSTHSITTDIQFKTRTLRDKLLTSSVLAP